MQEKALKTRATPQSNADTWAMVDQEGEQGTPRAVLQRRILRTSSPLTDCCTAPYRAKLAQPRWAQPVLQPGSRAARCPSYIPPHKGDATKLCEVFIWLEVNSSVQHPTEDRSASFPFFHQVGGRKKQSRSLGICGVAASVGIQLLFTG